MSVRTKVLGAVAVTAALSLTGAAPALAADTANSSTATSSGGAASGQSTPANCTAAGRRLARLEKVQTRISAALPKFQAAETKAQGSGHPKLAARIARRLSRLEKRQTNVSNRIARIEQRCPGVTPTGGGSSTSS